MLNRSSTASLALIVSLALSGVAAVSHALAGTAQSERLVAWKIVLTREQGSDSLWPMRSAYELASSDQRVNIYNEVIARRQVRFQYSTAALLPLALWDAACQRIPS